MPSHVRLFFVLAAAVVGYWIFQQAWFWFLIAPAVVFRGMLTNPDVRAIMEQNVVTLLLVTLPTIVAIGGLAWMAAFRRRHWARSVFVILVIVRELGIAIYQGGSYAVRYYVEVHWAQPSAYVPTILLLAASILIFTGNAHSWFQPPSKAISDVFS
jgi:hypothetical protein